MGYETNLQLIKDHYKVDDKKLYTAISYSGMSPQQFVFVESEMIALNSMLVARLITYNSWQERILKIFHDSCEFLPIQEGVLQ